jgi:hypothetical protein
MTSDHRTEADDHDSVPQSMYAPLPVLLVIGMGIGSVTLWALSPLFWLWFAARVAVWTGGETRLTPQLVLIILGGIITTTLVVGKLLGIMNRKHMRLTGLDRGTRHVRAWNKSMRDSRESTRDRGVLEPVMFASLGLAAVAFAIGIALSNFVLPG